MLSQLLRSNPSAKLEAQEEALTMKTLTQEGSWISGPWSIVLGKVLAIKS